MAKDLGIKLSVVIIAKNEEMMIASSLDSVKWADEVLVIDTGSTDRTVKVASNHGAKVIKYTSGKHFSEWRNRGLREAKGEWIFYLDADERVTTELKKEILREINYKPINVDHFNAYAIPRRNFIFGKEFKFSGQTPDYVKRLFRKSKFKGWKNELHEEPVFKGRLGHLETPMIHRKDITLSQMVEKTNIWSEIEAKLMYEAGHPKMNVVRFLSVMLREFWLRMIRQLAFLDGAKGIIYALYQVFSRFVSYAKLWEMQTGGKK